MYCCIAELSNLLVTRKGANSSVKPISETLNLSQLRFHQIKDKEFTKVRNQMNDVLNYVQLEHGVIFLLFKNTVWFLN